MNTILINADDFGQNESITHGIAELIALKRLHATSLMVNMPYAPQAAQLALHFEPQIRIGLHLNFTEGQPLSSSWKRRYGTDFPSLMQLMVALILGQIDPKDLRQELQCQWQRHTDYLGRCPDIIDGHQHVHQFPRIRQVLSDFLLEQDYQGLCRATHPEHQTLSLGQTKLKNTALILLGARSWQRFLTEHHKLQPASFYGFYPFAQSVHYRTFFRSFLKQSCDQGMIMCHPGHRSDDRTDPLHASRHHELEYFKSSEFEQDCKEFGFELA